MTGFQVRSWYAIHDDGDWITIEFTPARDRFWKTDVIREHPLPVEMFRGRKIRLTGSSSVWIYAHSAAVAAAARATNVEAETAAEGTSDDTAGSAVELFHAPGDEQRVLVELKIQPRPPLTPRAIESLIACTVDRLSAGAAEDVVLTGRGSVEAYAKLAIAAVVGDAKRISYFSPRTTGLVAIYRGPSDSEGAPPGTLLPIPHWLESHLLLSGGGESIGVVGDPNVGKSVFSAVLDYHRASLGIVGWRLDCDGQSMTAPWFLQLITAGDVQRAQQMREDQKRPWTPEMEEDLANQLRSLRRSLPVTIADLPGGHHGIDPPQRLPPGRHRLFEPIDKLVVIQRCDQPSAEDWRRELNQYGLDGLICAVLDSDEPASPPSLSGSFDERTGSWQGRVTGLDRSGSIERLHASMKDSLADLWRQVTRGDIDN